MVQLNFDARNISPMDNDTIPEGWYNLVIDESSSAPTKDGNPNHLRLNFRFSVMDGPHMGRKIFTGLNIRHTNVQTMEMANREMSAICHACNMPFVQDTQQLHNIPLKGRVKTRKDPTGEYDDRSEIRSYKPISFVPPGSVPDITQPAPQQGWTHTPGQQQPPQQPPQGWGTSPQHQPAPQQNYVQQPAPQQQYAPQTQQPAPQPNGGWQQPQQPQPWGQPPQQPPQQMAAPPQQTTQLPPVNYAEPPQQPPQQPVQGGFAAPTPPPQQPPQQPQQPHPAQQAAPPWVRQS
jgi:hypothetical protein